MRPVRTIAALVLATVGMLTLAAAPAGAAPATLQVSPASVTAGDTVTVSGSLGPGEAGSECASRLLLLSRAFDDAEDFAGVPMVVAAVKPDGAFAATTRIPRSRAAGSYTISGRCGGGNIGASATLTVRAAPAATTTPAGSPSATAAPATAPSATRRPQASTPVAGSATQPATPAADRLADRWVVPGLVALASGALAALAVWLLYRRLHPAGPGR
jgi:hypothetical protein